MSTIDNTDTLINKLLRIDLRSMSDDSLLTIENLTAINNHLLECIERLYNGSSTP